MRSGNLSIKQFNEIRNCILFISDWGGLGDVVIHRMCFEDVKKIIPDAKIHFCCLEQYMDIIKDHPFVDELIVPQNINKQNYLVFYQTDVKISNKYESHYGLNCKLHRSDIWALSCGYELTSHNMHFNIDEKISHQYKIKLNNLKKYKDKPTIILSPESAIRTKSLLPNQLSFISNKLKDFNVFVLGNKKDIFRSYDFIIIEDTSLMDVLYYIDACDMVISVDTAIFHIAGGLNKPLMGIFTFANGKTYGKYFDFILVQKHIDNGNWECGPCYNYRNCCKTKSELKPCLTEITLDEINIGIEKLLNKYEQNKISKKN